MTVHNLKSLQDECLEELKTWTVSPPVHPPPGNGATVDIFVSTRILGMLGMLGIVCPDSVRQPIVINEILFDR